MLANSVEYAHLLQDVKKEIAESRLRAVLRVNKELILMYWRIGRHIAGQAEWGDKYIETLSRDIRSAYPGVKGFSSRSLKYMTKFAREVDYEFVQQLAAQIPWGHIMYLLDKTAPGLARDWYVTKTAENGWSRAILMHHVESGLYERQALSEKVTNFDRSLPSGCGELAKEALKDPYIFDFITTEQSAVEHELEESMVRNLTSLLLELGTGFAFMGRQYHLQVGSQDFYIDLLFYNTRLHCYFVIELKTTEFKPEYVGKLNFYLAAVDDVVRDAQDNPTIGLLLCKHKDNAVAEYSLRNVASPIGVSEYRVTRELPAEVASVLPSPEDLSRRI